MRVLITGSAAPTFVSYKNAELLSLDNDLLNFVFQYSKPGINRLPYHVWLRIRAALGPLLVEREGGALVWYHRQLKEVGRERYAVNYTDKYAGLMGRYFGGLLEQGIIAERYIQAQPRFMNSDI